MKFSHCHDAEHTTVDATQLAGRRAERFRPNKVARLGNHQVEPPRHRGTAFDENGFVKNNAQRSNLLDFDQVDLDEYSDHDDEDRDEVIYDGRFPRRKQQPLRRLPKIERVTSIIPEFRRRHTTRNAYPWTRSSPATDSTEAKWRLHVEILEFYDFVRPHDFELKARKWVVDQIKHLVTAKGAPVKVLPFGSYATGLNLPTGDLDLVLVEPVWDRDDIEPAGKNQMRTALNKYSGLMRNSTFDTVNIIRHSRVPLIKFKERTTGIDVDLSFNNRGGIPAIDTVKQWAEQYRAMPPLVMIIKQLLLMRDLNDVAYQGMGSFTIICLVTSFLMNHPSQRIPQDREKNTRLGELLLDFLTFYGEEFDRDRKGIQMEQHQATYITKPKVSTASQAFRAMSADIPKERIT